MSGKGNEWYRAILSVVLLNMLHKTFDPVNEIILVCVRGSLLRSRYQGRHAMLLPTQWGGLLRDDPNKGCEGDYVGGSI